MQPTGALLMSPALIHSCTRGLIRPVSASFLSRPGIPSVQPSYSCGPLQVARQEFQTSVVSRDIDTAAEFIGAGAGWNPSLKQQLFSHAILGFALSEAMGLFWFDGRLPHPLHHVRLRGSYLPTPAASTPGQAPSWSVLTFTIKHNASLNKQTNKKLAC
ncbi:hypothetical protein FD754_021135 [Muntiacus muntjak]|uniref:Uncharacterized protein n=1 Tax=Muntiacus muntjak TaxID=9888 RepID=A0A5N3V5A9_MUNMU|nr:hypothetical protein FD754_021135 [Muntiacus muntjak]